MPEPDHAQLRRRQAVREAQRELGIPPEGAGREIRIRVVLAPWCEVSLQQVALESVTPEQIEGVVALLRATLEGELARKGRFPR